MTSKIKPKVIERKPVFSEEYIGVEEVKLDLGNKTKTIYSATYPEVVKIIPILDNETVILAEEYRPTIDKTLLEIPGGKITKGENLEKAAKRELVEEIGYDCKTLKKLITYYLLPGLTTTKVHIYAARELTKQTQNLDEDEYISAKETKVKDIPKLIENGKIADSFSIIGLLIHLNKK